MVQLIIEDNDTVAVLSAREQDITRQLLLDTLHSLDGEVMLQVKHGKNMMQLTAPRSQSYCMVVYQVIELAKNH